MSLTLVQSQMIIDTDLHVGQDDSTDYMDSMVLCPLNKKKKSPSMTWWERSQKLQGFARVHVAFSDLWFHTAITGYKKLRSMDSSSMYGRNKSITAPLSTSAPQLRQSWGTATFPSATVTHFFKTFVAAL